MSESLLGEYLKYVIDEYSDNICTLSGGAEQAASSDRGNVLPYAEKQGVVEPFVRSNNPTLGQVMSSYSNSGKFSNIDNFIDKTGNSSPRIQDEDGEFHSGHTLLSSIDGQDASSTDQTRSGYEPQSEVQKQVEDFLVENSRFNPAHGERFRAYAEKGTTSKEMDSSANSTSQSDFGKYDKNAVGMIADDLENVAKSLILKSAGWDNATDPASSIDPSENTLNAEGNTLTPDYENQMIVPSVLRSRNAYGAPQNSAGNANRAGRGAFITQDDMSETMYTKSISHRF